MKKILKGIVTTLIMVLLVNSLAYANSLSVSQQSKVSTKTITGYIGKVTEAKGKKYINFDKVEIVSGGETEYSFSDKDGKKYLKYGISKSAKYYLCKYQLNPKDWDIMTTRVTYNKFNQIYKKNGKGMFFEITIQNNVIVKIEEMYLS